MAKPKQKFEFNFQSDISIQLEQITTQQLFEFYKTDNFSLQNIPFCLYRKK